jgi:GNAT superfamily N-acetyltransferase
MLDYQIHHGRIPREVAAAVVTISKAVLGDLDEEEFNWNLENRHSLALWTCMANQTLAGYKLGFRRSRTKYYSWLGAVAEGWRRQGIATELMRRQHQWAREQGFRRIETQTLNRWKSMLLLNLREGFDITGIKECPVLGSKIILERDLRVP